MSLSEVTVVNGMADNVRTFISFDAPHKGANIPLGIQYWVKFFSGQSADADALLLLTWIEFVLMVGQVIQVVLMVFFPISEKTFALVYFVMSWVTVRVP